MKKIAQIIFFCYLFTIAFLSHSQRKSSSDVYVNGYTRSNGTYVQPHYRTAPNSTTFDNFSERGNINPYTGKEGSKNSYNSNNSTNYGTTSNQNITNSTYNNNTNNYRLTEPNNNIITPKAQNNYESKVIDEHLKLAIQERDEILEKFTKSKDGSEAINFNKKYAYKTRFSINYLLYKLGYEVGDIDGTINGNIDARTVLAIMQFQLDNSLNVDGKFGQSTAYKMKFAVQSLLD